MGNYEQYKSWLRAFEANIEHMRQEDLRLTAWSLGAPIQASDADGKPLPEWMTNNKGWAIDSESFDLPARPEAPAKKFCAGSTCTKELSQTLDAYYGQHPLGPGLCCDCRRKAGIR